MDTAIYEITHEGFYQLQHKCLEDLQALIEISLVLDNGKDANLCELSLMSEVYSIGPGIIHLLSTEGYVRVGEQLWLYG